MAHTLMSTTLRRCTGFITTLVIRTLRAYRPVTNPHSLRANDAGDSDNHAGHHNSRDGTNGSTNEGAQLIRLRLLLRVGTVIVGSGVTVMLTHASHTSRISMHVTDIPDCLTHALRRRASRSVILHYLTLVTRTHHRTVRIRLAGRHLIQRHQRLIHVYNGGDTVKRQRPRGTHSLTPQHRPLRGTLMDRQHLMHCFLVGE